MHRLLIAIAVLCATAGCAGVREVGPVTKKIHYPARMVTVNTAGGPQLVHQPDQYLLRRKVTLADGTVTEREYYVEYAEWLDAKVGVVTATGAGTP
jgi:hypothetical protein